MTEVAETVRTANQQMYANLGASERIGIHKQAQVELCDAINTRVNSENSETPSQEKVSSTGQQSTNVSTGICSSTLKNKCSESINYMD
jgi:hypothetical protein